MAVADPVGAQVHLGPVTAAATASAYAALSYTQIKKVESIGAFGPAANPVKFTPLETGVVEKKKGSIDYGDPEVVCFLDDLDPGQLAAITARGSRFPHAIKVVIPTAADGNDPESIAYFHAHVMSVTKDVGAADNVPRRRIALAITGAVIFVPTVATA